MSKANNERARAEWVLQQVEAELARIGGRELLADARNEARWFADLYTPWDGDGTEPLRRLTARLDVLALRLDRACGEQGDLA